MMGEETAAGEFYIDSLAVLPDYQHKGIATSLLRHVISVKRSTTPLGLLVDVGNPKAEALYTSLGFRFCDFNTWGGHKMKHLVLPKLV